MFVLSRKRSESVEIDGANGCQGVLKATAVEIRGGTVKLGFEADADVPILRSEVSERTRTGGRSSRPVSGATVLRPRRLRE